MNVNALLTALPLIILIANISQDSTVIDLFASQALQSAFVSCSYLQDHLVSLEDERLEGGVILRHLAALTGQLDMPPSIPLMQPFRYPTTHIYPAMSLSIGEGMCL